MSPHVLLDVGGTNTWTEAPYSVLPKSITHRPGKDSNLNLSFSPCTSLSPWEYRKSSGENIKQPSKMPLLVVKVFQSANYLWGNYLN